MKTSISKFAIVVAMVLSCTVCVASADMMTHNGMGLKASVRIHAPGVNTNTHAGQMLIGYGGEDHIGYCVDIYHNAGSMEADELTLSSLNNGDMVAFLFETYADGVSTGLEAAALQVAIWEVINEDDANDFDAQHGEFHVTGNNNVRNAANVLLASLPTSYTTINDFYVLHNDDYQDMLIMVPEPGTMALLCLGGAYSLIRRRRRK